MKKIIIALLVVLSVFALVSCSSSEPVVTAQTLTLNTKANGTDSWTTQYAYNKTGYGVWYKNAAGKYVAVATATGDNAISYGTALTDADGKEIGKLGAKFKDLTQTTHTIIDGKENAVTTYLGTEFTLAVKGDSANAGVWTGEVAVAAKAVSDTQLSGVVGKYNVTFTNTVTVTPVTYYDLGAVKLAYGGDYKPGTDNTKIVFYAPSTGTEIDVSQYAIFEQLAGGYKFAGDTMVTLTDADNSVIGDVTLSNNSSQVTGNFGVEFKLEDRRQPNSYKQFVDYSFASKTYVLARKGYDLSGTEIVAEPPVATFALSADMPADRPFKAAGTVNLTNIWVDDAYDHVGLFVLDGDGNYVDLNDYYIGEPVKDEGLAVGCATVTESSSSSLVRNLEVVFKCEDAQGECDPENVKSLGVLSETVDVKLCSYTDYADEKTYSVIATLKMYFENRDAVKYELTSSTSGEYYVDYCVSSNEAFAINRCWIYDADGVGNVKWTSIGTIADGVGEFKDVQIGDYKCDLIAKINDGTNNPEIPTGYVRFSLSYGVAATSATKKFRTVYVKFTKNAQDEAASTKLAFDCTAKASPN